jgi:hypothetical protein
MKKILLSPDPGIGGDPAQPSSAPEHVTTPPPAPPPAATTVLQGTKSERELQLEEENKKLAEEKKQRELKINELEDENHRLKQIPATPASAEPEDDGTWRVFDV